MKNRIPAKAVLTTMFVLACGSLLLAVVPKKWDLRGKEDWLRGKFSGVSVSSEGVLSLAPKEVRIEAPAEEFYMSVLVGEDGATYLGTGHSGKIYRIGQDGKAELYFQAQEMDVTCLLQDKKGTLYAGTSPNGKVYKITGKGKGAEFFNPAERYIWDLAFTDSGLIWAAVGEVGGIYVIAPTGEGRMLFKANENHILCLEKLASGDFIAGSGGRGLVYRLSPEGKASVIFETPYEEVRSLAVGVDGRIYAAASGTPSAMKGSMPIEAEPSAAPVRVDADVQVTVSAQAPATVAVDKKQVRPLVGGQTGGRVQDAGAVFVISGDGVAKTLWSSPDEMVYSLALRPDDGGLIFGTGGNGRLYSIDRAGKQSMLLQMNSEQIYRIMPVLGRMKILANNPCYLGDVMPEQSFEGEYTSAVLDAGMISTWGRISWEADVPAGSVLQFQTRSGNTVEPNSTWSEWSPLYSKQAEQVLSLKARYLQFKALFRAPNGKTVPTLGRAMIHYLQTNTAPVINRFEMLPANEVMLKLPDGEDVILGAEKNLADPLKKQEDDLRVTYARKKAERAGFQTVTWDAADDNGDELEYTVSIRRDNEKDWRKIESGIRDGIFAFDTLSFPDGSYYLKIEASDAPSNPVDAALVTEKISPVFVIDNSQPVFKNFTARRNGQSLDIEFDVEDGYSMIEEVKYLVRPDEWRVVFPVDGICDSRSEKYRFTVKLPSGADNMIAVRARDSHGKVGIFRQTF